MQYEFDILTIEWAELNTLADRLNEKGKEGFCVVNVYESSKSNDSYGKHDDGTPYYRIGVNKNYYHYVLQRIKLTE